MWEACLSPRAMVTSRPGLLPRVTSGSVVLLQPWSEVDTLGSYFHQGLWGCLGSGPPPGVMLVFKSHAAAMDTDLDTEGPAQLPGARITMDPGCCQRPCLSPRFYRSQGLC